jgi:organic radical activating enzyme
MMNLFEMLQAIFGKNIMSRTIGTRTNVIKFPSNKNNPTTTSFDVFRASENPAVIEKIKKVIADEAPYIARMNDSERAIYEGNVRRLHDHLVSTGEVTPKESAPVIGLENKAPITGKNLETLTDEQGLIASPKTSLGEAQFNIKRKEQELKDFIEKNMFKDMGKDILSYQEQDRQGLVRATARQILDEDIKAGKIKGLTIKDLNNTSEPINPFREIYGEDALEQLDSLSSNFKQLRTEKEAADLARSKFKFEVNENRPKESYTKEEMDQILKNAPEANSPKGLDYLTGGEPKPEAEIIPFNKKPPEGKADGGRIGYQTGGPTNKLLQYMIDMLVKEKDFNRKLLERSKPELVEGLFKQTYGKSAEEISNAVNQQLKGKSSMEVMNSKTGEITSPTEPVKTARTTADIEKEIDELSTTPITTLEKKRKYNDLHSEFINSLDPRGRNKNLDYRRKSLDLENRLLLKAEEKGLDFDTFEKLRQDLYGSKKQQTLDFMRTGKVNLEPIKPATTFEEVQDRHKIAAKAADEVFPNYNDPKTAAQELAEVMAEQKYKKSFGDLTGDKQSDLYSEAYNYITSVNKLPKVSPANVPTEVLQNKMNEVLNQYDKSMFIKNEQGMVDITHPENVAKMEELLRRDHPELHSQLKKLGTDLDQKETLLDFDVTGRKPNAQGGIIRKKYGHEGIANPKKAQITAIYGEGTLPKDYSKGLGYLSGE